MGTLQHQDLESLVIAHATCAMLLAQNPQGMDDAYREQVIDHACEVACGQERRERVAEHLAACWRRRREFA